jgi:glycosyltransferase involved in cell wall biosynthesis
MKPKSKPTCVDNSYRVLLVSSLIPPVYAGAGMQWYRYARRLEQRGELAYLLSLDPTAQDYICAGFQAEVSDQKIIRMPACKVITAVDSFGKKAVKLVKIWWACILFFRVGWFLYQRRNEYELVHVTSSPWICVFSLFWAKILKKVSIYETSLAHSDDLLSIRKTRFLSYCIIKHADAILAISPQLYDLCRKGGANEYAIHLIANPRDTDHFKPVDGSVKATLRHKLHLPENGPVILFVGAILERKGVDLLPEIFRRVLKAFPTACLLLVGPEVTMQMTNSKKSAAEFVRSELQDCLKTGQLIFAGNVWNVNEYMQVSDVFLFPSRNEGLPNAPIEAMSCGLPCIVRDIEGVSAVYINDGVDGVIIHGEKPGDYAQAVIRLLTNNDEYLAMAKKARQKVLSRWSTEITDREYRLIYEKYL